MKQYWFALEVYHCFVKNLEHFHYKRFCFVFKKESFVCSGGGVLSARNSLLFAVKKCRGLLSLLSASSCLRLEGESLGTLEPTALGLCSLVWKDGEEDILVTLLLAILLILLPQKIRRMECQHLLSLSQNYSQ